MTNHKANVMRWDCEKQGCFNVKMRVKLNLLFDCFPGAIGLSDLDGFVEYQNKFLILEWKSFLGDIPTGQRIAFERFSSVGDGTITVIGIVGNAEDMSVTHLCRFSRGHQTPWKAATFQDLHKMCVQWVHWARNATRTNQ